MYACRQAARYEQILDWDKIGIVFCSGSHFGFLTHLLAVPKSTLGFTGI